MKEKTLRDNRSTMKDEDGELTYWYREDFVKKAVDNVEIKILKKFGMAGGVAVMKIIKEEIGEFK